MTVVYVLSFILSGCSLLYELLIAQTLSLIAGNMVIWYSLTVGTYLAAMGVGAILYGSAQRFRELGRGTARRLRDLRWRRDLPGGRLGRRRDLARRRPDGR